MISPISFNQNSVKAALLDYNCKIDGVPSLCGNLSLLPKAMLENISFLDYKRTVHGYDKRIGFHPMPMQRIPLADDAYLFVSARFLRSQGRQGLLSAHFNSPRNLSSLLNKIEACWHLPTDVRLQKKEYCMNLGLATNYQ